MACPPFAAGAATAQRTNVQKLTPGKPAPREPTPPGRSPKAQNPKTGAPRPEPQGRSPKAGAPRPDSEGPATPGTSESHVLVVQRLAVDATAGRGQPRGNFARFVHRPHQ